MVDAFFLRLWRVKQTKNIYLISLLHTAKQHVENVPLPFVLDPLVLDTPCFKVHVCLHTHILCITPNPPSHPLRLASVS